MTRLADPSWDPDLTDAWLADQAARQGAVLRERWRAEYVRSHPEIADILADAWAEIDGLAA